MLSRCILDFSVGVGLAVLGLSQISSFLLIILSYTRLGICNQQDKWEDI